MTQWGLCNVCLYEVCRQPLPGGKGGSQMGRFQRILRRSLSAMIAAVAMLLIFRAAALLRLASGLVAGKVT